MSAKILSGFEFILSLQGREVTIERLPTTATVNMASSNYFRNLAGLEETAIEGREYVVSKRELDDNSFPTPRRGDLIVDPVMGENSVDEVREMIILGNLVGYRLRTS